MPSKNKNSACIDMNIKIQWLPKGKYLLICLLIFIFRTAFAMQEGRIDLNLSGNHWTVVAAETGEGERQGYHAHHYPVSRSIPATVPGDIHWDLMRAKVLPDIFIGMNAKKAYPYALKEWWYRKVFTIEKGKWKNKRIKLNFNGVDYAAKIWLNGHFLGSHTGQFTPFSFEVNDIVLLDKENELIVLIEPAPKNIIDAFVNGNRWATNAYPIVNETLKFWKSRTMTGWDWGTRLWSMGIWQDVTLTATTNVYLGNLLIYPETKAPYKEAKLKVKVDIDRLVSADIELTYAVKGINDKAFQVLGTQLVKAVDTKKSGETTLTIKDPALWWPNGYGKQNLYLLSVAAKDKKTGKLLDTISSRFGIREIKIIENPGKDEHSQPDKRAKYLTEINGQRIFLHGGNWLPADLLYGRPGKKEYEHLIRMASLANYNVLRIWSGGLIEKQIFYDLCDQYGILVYQEMPNAFAAPLDTPEILKNMAQEQRQVMPLLINHPAVFRYGFANELYLFSNNSKHVRQYEQIAAELDPSRPAYGSDPDPAYQGHGPYSFGFPSGYLAYNTGHPAREHGPADALEVTEYSVAGASSFETIEKIIPADIRWPISSIDTLTKLLPSFPMELTALPTAIDSVWLWHNGLSSFGPLTWLSPDIYRLLLGERPRLEEEIQSSQFAQAEGYRYANQSHRRAQWRRSGCYMWTFNEPWPNAAHGSIVEYYGMPKMAFYYTRNAYAPVNVSIKYNTISLHPSDTLRLPVFATNATPNTIVATLKVQIVDLNGTKYLASISKAEMDAVSSNQIDSIVFAIPKEANDNVLLVRLDLVDNTGVNISSETYTFGVSTSPDQGTRPYMKPMLHAPQANLQLTTERKGKETWGGTVMTHYRTRVVNTSRVPALFVQLKSHHKPNEVYFKDNYFILLPGEKKVVDILVSPGLKNPFDNTSISVQAWNAKT
jgi:beta-mannosidase